jgi:hypothetical protein
MIGKDTIFKPDAISSTINLLFQNKLSTSKQIDLTDILSDKKLPAKTKIDLTTLVTDYFDQTNSELLVSILRQTGYSTLSKSNLVNILYKNQADSTANLNMLNLLGMKKLTVFGQEIFLDTLSAKNLQPSSQSALINSLGLVDQDGANLQNILSIVSKITLSTFNMPKIVDLFQNTSDYTQIVAQLNSMAGFVNNDLNSLDDKSLNNMLLNYTGFLNPCLLNCSMKGDCQSINGSLECFCKRGFQGSDCSSPYNPCEVDPCLNNSTCILYPDINDPDALSFECECSDLYYGDYCENKVNVCFNETCSKHGNCVDKDGLAVCECWEFFYGTVCENQQEEVVIREKVTAVSMATAICFLSGFYVVIILFDVLKFVCNI